MLPKFLPLLAATLAATTALPQRRYGDGPTVEVAEIDADDTAAPSRVINGSNTNTRPYMVSLRTKSTLRQAQGHPMGSSHHCGGSLIAREWVLTARHCTPSFTTKKLGWTYVSGAKRFLRMFRGGAAEYTAFIGGNVLNSWNEYEIIPVAEEICPPVASPANPHYPDLCLLRLAWPADESRGVLPLARGEEGADAPGKESTALGWGRTSSTNTSLSATQLQTGVMPIMSNDVCNKGQWGDFGPAYALTDEHLCVGEPNSVGVCSGDSGSPLVSSDGLMQIGVASLVITNACNDGPANFVKVAPHFKWIQTAVGEKLVPSRSCYSRVPHISDEWCREVRCQNALCEWRGSQTGAYWDAFAQPANVCVARAGPHNPGKTVITDGWCQSALGCDNFPDMCEWQPRDAGIVIEEK